MPHLPISGYNNAMSINKYNTECATCFAPVAKGEGVYEYPHTYCTEPVIVTEGMKSWMMCVPKYNRQSNTAFTNADDARRHEWNRQNNDLLARREQVRFALVNGGLQQRAAQANVRSLDKVILKHVGVQVAIESLTWEQAVAVSNDLHRRIERKQGKVTLAKAKESNMCTRCGGAGQSDRWAYTGRVCYDCGGTGKFFNEGSI